MVQLYVAILRVFKGLKKYCTIGLLCLVWLDSWCQENEFIHVTKLESGQGLSSPNVRKILRDPFGFIWTATQDGLNRFDGFSFVHFSSNQSDPKRTILENDVQDILIDSAHQIVRALTSYGGISSIDINTNNTKDHILLDSLIGKVPTGWYSCMAQQHDTLLVGTQRGFLLRIDLVKKNITRIIDTYRYFGQYSRIDKIFIAPDGNTWVFSAGNGILVLNDDFSAATAIIKKSALLQDSNPLELTFYDLAYFQPAHLMIASSHGIKTLSLVSKQLVSNTVISRQFPASLPGGEFYALQYAAPYLYLAHANALYRCNLQQGDWKQLMAAGDYNDNQWLHPVNSILAEGNRLWLGNQLGLGWVKNTSNAFTKYNNSSNGSKVELKHCYFIYPVNDSIAYTCSSTGVYQVNLHNGVITMVDESQPYYNIFKTPDNELIASGDKGMIFLHRTREFPFQKYPELKAIENDFIISSARYSDSLILLASQLKKGIYAWNPRSRTVSIINDTSQPIALKSLLINRLFMEAPGICWVVCDNLLSKWNIRNNTIEHFELRAPEQSSPLHILMDICGTGPQKWVAIYGTGIAAIDEQARIKKLITTNDGLTNLGIYKIFQVHDSLLIATSNNGLFLYNLRAQRLYRFFEEDGIHSNNFEETSGNSYGQQLLAGGIHGLTRIDIRKLSFHFEKPVCYFTHIQIRKQQEVMEDSADLFFKELTIPSDAVQATVHFTGLYLSNPGKLQFQYRIRQIHAGWTDNGNKTFIPLIGLSPGTYDLEVRALNENGVHSDPISVSLVWLPKWYQTLVFKIAIALLASGIIYALYRARIRQLKREEEIRKKLSKDLHDDLGGTLNSVKIYASLALDNKDYEGHLQNIKSNIHDAIVSTRDMIWVLDDKQDRVDNLLERLLRFATPLCDAQGIKLQKEIGEGIWQHKLRKEEKRNLYMILKETISNSVKYSSCNTIRIIMNNTSGRFTIQVSDNGRGFNTSQPSQGNGIKNIHTRAAEAGFHATIISSVGSGTSVILEKS